MIAESFIFVPFRLKNRKDFYERFSREEEMLAWGWQSDRLPGAGGKYRNHYLLRYVVDRVDSGDAKKRQCFHYLLTGAEWKKFFPQGWGQRFVCHKNIGSEQHFSIAEVHLYFFSTGIGILAYRLVFDTADARVMADVLYQLKRPRKKGTFRAELRPPHPEAAATPAPQYDMLLLSQYLTAALQPEETFEFFFYNTGDHDYRCNTLSLLETEADGAYLERLYFLRNGYGMSFAYMEDEEVNQREVFRTSSDRIWGIAPEGAACIAPAISEQSRKFTEGTFHTNFDTHYLFMFILALHQKYELYHFLTSMGAEIQDEGKDLELSLGLLENYRRELYVFEKDFSFAVITEVPQYQLVYERLRLAFNLDKMYNDVHEPLVSLSELRKEQEAQRREAEERRREAQEQRQREQDATVNRALTAISILAIFSALVDSFDLLRELFYGDGLTPLIPIPEIATWIILFTDLAVIAVIFICQVWIPLRRGARRKD